MSKKHDGDNRGFYHLSRAWYGEVILENHAHDFVDEVMFGYYSGGGGTSGEMRMLWRNLGGKPTPQLEVFSDAWSALATFGDVIAELGKRDGITPPDFCALLLACGFTDLTPAERAALGGK